MRGKCLLALALFVGAPAKLQAEIRGVEIQSIERIPGTFGSAGDYELLRGRYYGELDPLDPRNTIITDIELAPRNARGWVEYSASFALAKPVDMSRFSGVLFYDVPNRGNGAARGDADGHVHLISGWQGDIPASSDLQWMQVPVARNLDGSPVTGKVLARIVDPSASATSLELRAGIGAGVPRPEPLTLHTDEAQLVRKRHDVDRGVAVSPSDWAFADCRTESFPGKPDPRYLCVRGGFDPAFAYELVYTAKDPPVLGIGFAGVRDLVAFLRYAPSGDVRNPIAGQVRSTIAVGYSQSGNFLRSFIHLGFNQAENGRSVFDGVIPLIAARQLALNIRFGVPGGAASLYEPGSDGTLWWGSHRSHRRSRQTSLLARCAATQTCPKIMEIFGSAEFWGLRASPNLVGFDAKMDIPLPPNVRRYYMPSVTHGGGSGGFDLAVQPPPSGCVLPANPNPSSDTTKALVKAMVKWITVGTEPPASRYPRLDADELVTPAAAAVLFPKLPGAFSPAGKLNGLSKYEFGRRFVYDDVSGVIDRVPARIAGEASQLVPHTNSDGNETSGVASVQLRVPLGTYLGWNVQARGYYANQACGFQGGYIPFAASLAERLAVGDPRPSLEERYGDHASFVTRVRQATEALQAEGFLLADDAARIVGQAQLSRVLRKSE